MRNFTFGWLLSLLMITSFAFTTNAQTNSIEGSYITCSDYYSSGSITLNFTLNHTTGPEVEYLNRIEMLFPTGITPVSASSMITYSNQETPVNPITDQYVTWGNGSGYGEMWGTINFTVDVTVDANVSGTQIIGYMLKGDHWQTPDTVTAMISIDPVPSCYPVNNVQVSEITPESVKVAWVKGDEETNWNVIYGAQGFNPASEGTTVAVTDTFTTINDLNSSTQYDVYVQANCGGGDLSPLSDVVTFTTQVSCPNPTAGEVHEATPTTVTVKWVKGYQETAWKLVYGMGSFDPATAGTTVDNLSDTIYTIEGLNPETNYSFYVQADCGGELSELAWGGWFMTPATCPTPNSMVIDSKTNNSVTLSWTPGGEETAWNIIYGEHGFNVDTEGETVAVTGGTPTTTITGLQAGMSYDVYMQADCGNGSLSDAIWGTYFVTDCNAVTDFPLEEGFEEDYPLNCWSYVYESATPNLNNNMTHTTDKKRTGSHSFRFSSWYSQTGGYGQYMISPELSMTEELEMSFWYAKYATLSADQEEVFAVGISTTGNDTADFTWSDDVIVANTDWMEFSQMLSADVKYVAIR